MKKSWWLVISFFYCFHNQTQAHEGFVMPESDLAVIVISLKVVWVTLGSVGIAMLVGPALGCCKHYFDIKKK